MINVSNEFIQAVAQNTKTEFKATLTLADGTVREIEGADVMAGAPSFTDATSSMSSFDVGAAIIGQFDVRLNNYAGDFDAYDFTGAEIVPSVGVRLAGGTVEWVRKGRYLVEQPRTYGTVIGLTCLDLMSRFERTYDDVTTRYPATLQTIVADMCAVCNVPMESGAFANCEYAIQERPKDGLTCLAMLSYVCQIAGCFARMTNVGTLRIAWYDTAAFESEDWLDGEYFDDGRPYQSGDTADGGNFVDYSSGDAYDGGSFARRPWVNMHAFSSMSILTDDVVVTGVQVTAQDDKSEDEGGTGQEGETTLWGSKGYVLEVSDNPLVAFGKSAEVAAQIGERVVGMRFRPFDISALGDPSIEAGDPVVVTDRKQNSYRSYITSLTYKAGSYAAVSCGAETPSRNSAKGFSALTRAIVEARRAVRDERTDRERAIEQLSRELDESSGLYVTPEEQPDGSTIYYMHDKPELSESGIVWKMTAEAIGISTDGGETYPYGLDVSGTAILNRIYTIGLDADYINTGSITVRDPRTRNVMFSADYDTGEVYVNGASVKVDTSTTLTDALGAMRSNITSLQQDSQGISATVTSMQAVYATCGTAQGTAAKVATCADFKLRKGAMVSVKFTYANTASNPTLNVNNTGAKAIYLNSAPIQQDNWWASGDIVTLVYSGVYWYVVDGAVYKQLNSTNEAVSSLELRADSFDVSIRSTQATYGTCSTAASTQTKVVTIAGFAKYVGATVTVRFTYANTATNPMLKLQADTSGKNATSGYIYVNGSNMGSAFYWKAGDVVTFVWDGTYWRVGDGGTLSQIQVLKDSIKLEVTNFALGSTASIKMSVGGSTVTSASADLSKVRQAFANDSSQITISAGRVTFNTGTFVVNSTYFKVSSTGVITATSGTIGGFTISSSEIYNSVITLRNDGLRLKRDGIEIGQIGTNNMTGYSYQRGLVFDLEASGNYMAWAAKSSSSDSSYTIKLLYANKTTNGFAAGRLSVSCDLDLRNYRAYNFWIDPNTGGANGGITGTMSFVKVTGVRKSDGTLTNWVNDCRLQFKNGLLISATW